MNSWQNCVIHKEFGIHDRHSNDWILNHTWGITKVLVVEFNYINKWFLYSFLQLATTPIATTNKGYHNYILGNVKHDVTTNEATLKVFKLVPISQPSEQWAKDRNSDLVVIASARNLVFWGKNVSLLNVIDFTIEARTIKHWHRV